MSSEWRQLGTVENPPRGGWTTEIPQKAHRQFIQEVAKERDKYLQDCRARSLQKGQR